MLLTDGDRFVFHEMKQKAQEFLGRELGAEGIFRGALAMRVSVRQSGVGRFPIGCAFDMIQVTI